VRTDPDPVLSLSLARSLVSVAGIVRAARERETTLAARKGRR